ncbi:MAG TPA: hypothetical protein VK421_06240 [Pyrinomonadaceae bacterium]|nr:hypothetical protein [Pyrinomonadaceae bacterium]
MGHSDKGIILGGDGCTDTIWPDCKGIIQTGDGYLGTILTGGD